MQANSGKKSFLYYQDRPRSSCRRPAGTKARKGPSLRAFRSSAGSHRSPRDNAVCSTIARQSRPLMPPPPGSPGSAASPPAPCAIFDTRALLAAAEAGSAAASAAALWTNAAWTRNDGADETAATASRGDGTSTPLQPDEEMEIVVTLSDELRRGATGKRELVLPSGRKAKVVILAGEGVVVLSLDPPPDAGVEPAADAAGGGPEPTLRRRPSMSRTIAPLPHSMPRNGHTLPLPISPPPALAWFTLAFSRTIMGPLIERFPWHTSASFRRSKMEITEHLWLCSISRTDGLLVALAPHDPRNHARLAVSGVPGTGRGLCVHLQW